MKGNLKRILSAFLALALVLSCVPPVFAAEAVGSGSPVISGPLSLTAPADKDQEISFAPNKAEEEETEQAQAPAITEELTKFEPSAQERFSKSEAAVSYEADDLVTFIVVTEEKPQLELFSVGDIAAQTASVQRHQNRQISALSAVKSLVKSSFGTEEGFEMGFTYTIATTGFSVTTAFGNKAKIEKMVGVKSVYVAPTFAIPETQDAELMTNNATTMIGADVLNGTGYTGKGQRIAILDTGILVDHPNFAALPDEKLEDPMTRESVEAVWKTLNAGQMTSRLNTSYYNSKIPFVFNYVSGDFNVSNTFAGSDHGTHVAGISAANKIDSSNVIGVAPDAQLVVMQVFQSGGGADWATIMAALEDCVRLEVDAANLSLGAAAGYTDPADDMLGVLDLFKESDIQVLIASGNDTNNALMNAWGLDMSLIGNPDIGLAGTPSTYTAALAVASVDNDGAEQFYFTVDGKDYGFQDTGTKTIFVDTFRNQTLDYVVVPGLGTEEDYEGLDVTGKIALVSRGTTSFPEKQAMAQEKGAIGCVIYNNTLGLFLMQINDTAEDIPAVSIDQAAGQAMIAAAGDDGVGTLTVCNADMKQFNVDRTVSSFSSWGVTPDLKLKPEISGVGGGIYATVDPAISGSYYGPMSGTSMATPQITGAMAVLIQYLDENYPEITGSAQRHLAANLLMSTADPVMVSSELEYSPRAQGAGLANLVKATTTPAYLSNLAATESRPKVEFGDDPNKTGVWEFSFQVNNLTGEAQTYAFDSSVLTESIYEEYFIAGSPYGLEAKVETPDQVTVPANGSVTVNAKLTLTAADKAYLKQFPNGMYVEGYLYATPVSENAEGVAPVTLTMPMVGFYGDWSAAPIFDDPVDYSLYPTVVYTYNSQLGKNPYFRNGKSGEEYNSFSYSNPLAEIDFGMLRNAKRMDISVTNTETGEVYHTLDGQYMTKTYFSTSYGQIVPTFLMIEYGEVWDGMNASGGRLADGTEITYSFKAWLDDGDDVMDDSWSFNAKVDTVSPEILNDNDLQSALRMDTETGRSYLTLELKDNQHIAALLFESPTGVIMGKYEIDNVPGETFTGEYEITGFGSEFTIILADYACNETEAEVLLNLGDQSTAKPTPAQLSKERIYGNETYDGALVEGGWFSANKADLSDPRNETFDSANRYYSGEFVNGYIVAQNANTGHLELVTPTGTYWSTEILCQNRGAVGDSGVWVLYDMALDHSGTLAASYNVANEAMGTDGLFAVGWQYQGDNNNDGKDDGHNALFHIKFTTSGDVMVNEIARIAGTDGADLLTLGITTEGAVYGIDTNGILYSVGTSTVWDDTVGQYGDYVIPCTPIGNTSFVNYPGYGGTNVIQSMGYDHNTGTMYWYAHSQVQSGYTWDNINVTYKVDLDTGKCTEVGTYGPGGQTCLFVPNDLQSDLFTMGGEPKGLSIDPYATTIVAGQTTRLKIKWQPWSADAVPVTWASADESIATVDQYGFVTAHAAGTVNITATATVNADPYWDYDAAGNWVQFPGGPTETTVSAQVTVVPGQDELYGFAAVDFNTGAETDLAWYTFSDTNPQDVTRLGTAATLYQGGAYYNGYVYTVAKESWEADGVLYQGSVLYRSPVTEGETPDKTVIGAPTRIGAAEDVELGNLGFDYNTGRMYAVDLTGGGLAIVDLETGAADCLGTFSGDCGGPIIATAMCVTADGTIIIADMYSNLYTVNPDTLATTYLYQSGANSWYYAAMCYDYNTGNIYWNPCMSDEQSPLNMVILPANEWEQATIVDMGDVGGKKGAELTVMFTIPENEPETKVLPVESIDITNGDKVIGLEGGTLQLSAVTVPARPTIQTKTWTSSDESVVTVDRFGSLTYVGVGTATVTVSITNKDEATYGGPFTDSVEVTVLEAAGEFVAFLTNDDGGTSYYDFWLKGNDYDLAHTSATQSMISIYSLRTGAYYDGYFYGFTDKGAFLRIDAADPGNYKVLGNSELDYANYQVTGMAMDYTTGTMYGLTMPSNYNTNSSASETHPGELVTIDLDTGKLTTVATLDFATPVYALACDADGQLYAAGGTFDYYAESANIYKLDKATGALTYYTVIEGACVYTGTSYYSNIQYNTQMTYDYGTDRLYLYATTDHNNYHESFGMYMVQLGEEPTVADLGEISLYVRVGELKHGKVSLGLLSFIPEAEELPVNQVNGIILNTNSTRVAVGGNAQLTAKVRPANAADQSLTWSVADESIATVDQNGLVSGVALGTTTVTATSNQTGVTATCRITVIDVSGPQSVAYTVSAKKDSLISFNPAMPAQTAEVVATLSGGSTIKGMAYGDNCLYYVQEIGYNYYLYRFDFTTRKSTELTQLEAWTGISGIAYDKDNNFLYAVGGFYLFQYDLSNLSDSGMTSYTNYVMDSDYSTLTGVAVVDGAVYTFGNDYYDAVPQMIRYADKFLADRTVVLKGLDMSLVPGSTDVAYDSSTALFYFADPGHMIHTMDMDGNVTEVDVLGDGLDLYGLAITPALTHRIVYTDGVEDAVVFADQVYFAVPDAATPAFTGTPKREGYTFAGWSPAVAETVSADTVYTATWTPNTYSLVLVPNGGTVDPAYITATYDAPIGQLPVPVREGYLFDGWYDVDGNLVTAETIYTWAGMTSITAKWIAPVAVNVNTGATYFELSDALAEAQNGNTVQLLTDCDGGNVMVTKGITLDLNGKNLTASYVVAFETAHVIDSQSSGSLITGKKNVVLTASNAMVPVYTGSAYVFTKAGFAVRQDKTYQGSGIKIQAMAYPVNMDVVKLLADGGTDNNVQIVIRLTWDTADGTGVQDLVFNDNVVAQVYSSNRGAWNNYGKAFSMVITGHENIENLKASIAIVSGTHVEYLSSQSLNIT